MIQLAWNLSSTVAPVAFAWLLDRGSSQIWVVLAGMSLVGAALTLLLGRVLPHAAQEVTNRAEDPLPA